MKRWVCVAALLLVAGTAVAQPPVEAGDAQAMAARPLLVGDLPVGTVTVRVGRGSLSNAAVGVQVVATVTVPGGKAAKRTEETKSDGRATFSDLPVGAEFRAEAAVDGEQLQTASFAVPGQGGARLMLLSQEGHGEGEEEASALANPHAGAPGHGGHAAQAAVRALSGAAAEKAGLAAGTLELRLVDGNGAPVVGQEVKLGHGTGRPEAMAFVASKTDKDGFVRFQGLETGDPHEYVAAIDRDGVRLGSGRIRLSSDRGAAGELRVPGQTRDPSVLQVSGSSKLLIDLREDALAVMENLVLENTSDRVFSAGQGGLAIPLPAGSSSGSPIEGGARLEPDENSTMFLREAVPPASFAGIPVQARFGFFLPTAGESSITFRQPMPLGIESPVVMVPESDHLTLTAPGLQAMASQTDDRGARMQIFQLASVPRNGVLSIAISGLPTRGSLGKTITTALVAVLIFAMLLGWRRPRVEKRPARVGSPPALPAANHRGGVWGPFEGPHVKMNSRRDRLFTELVEAERARRAAGADDAPLAQRRAELVAAIAAVDGERAGDADAASPSGKST